MQVKLKVSRVQRDPKTRKITNNSPGDVIVVSDGEGNALIAKGRAELVAMPTPKKRTTKPKAIRKTEE